MILDTLDTSFSTEEIVDPLPEAGLTLLIAVGVNLVVFDFFFFLVLETLLEGGVVFRPVSTNGIATVDTLPWRRYPG